ncbi:unnamed protein product [Heligmosomoides polygyrus]|uniref:Ubiquitin-like domain-containing protein n=1 Tax=Heligmosomoides polygyrus TaxID=6339 RepID=A0A183GAS2_HELPZ|nr:unnamed protein product [Heligmosomoides polygyrus]
MEGFVGLGGKSEPGTWYRVHATVSASSDCATRAHLSVIETKMLRWTAGVTSLDRVRNDTIQQRFGVAPIAEKPREARLRWYGHVLRASDDTVRKIGLNLEVLGKRPRGRPKQRWLDSRIWT